MEQRTTQGQLPEDQLFSDAFKASPIGIALEDLEGRPLFVNPALCEMLGYSEEEMRNKHFVEFSSPEDAQKDWALFQQLRAGSIDHYHLDKRFLRRDGSLFWGRVSISLLNQRPSSLIVATVEDITEKKTLQETLDLATRQLTAAVTRCSRDFRYLWANQAYADWLQRPLDEIVGRPIIDVLGKEAFETLRPYFERVLRGENVSCEQKANFRGIGARWVSAAYVPTLDGNGVANGWVAVVNDITERKRVEATLRESEESFRLANAAPVMIWVSGIDKRCTYVNQGWLEFTGRSSESELARDWADGIHPEDLERCLKTYEQAFDRREPFRIEYRLQRKDGEYRWLLDHGVPRFNADGCFAGYIGSAVDITERKLEEEVRFRLATIMESSNDAIISTNLEGMILGWNSAAQRIYGYTREEAIGQPITITVPRDLHTEAIDTLRRVRAGEHITAYQTRRVSKDGKKIEVSITVFPIKDAAYGKYQRKL